MSDQIRTALNQFFIRNFQVICLLAISTSAYAVDRTWIGGGATADWTVAGNWDPAAIPGAADILFFNGASTTSMINRDKQVSGFRFSGTGNHVINGGTGGGALGLGGDGIQVLGSTQTVTFSVWFRPSGGTGTFSVYNDGALNISSNFQVTSQHTVTFDGAGTTTVGYLSRRRANYDMSLVKNGSGTLIINGSENAQAIADVGPTQGTVGFITGDVVVNNGLLLANNSNGSATGGGNVLINANGRLGGTGSLTGGGSKSITLASGLLLVGTTHGQGGTAQDLQLGSSTAFNIGSVTSTNVAVNLSGTLQFDIMGAGSLATLGLESYDTLGNNDILRISTTGAVSLDSSSIFIAAANTTGWAEGQSWKLIDWSNYTVGSFSADNLNLATTYINGWYLTGSVITSGTGAGYYVTASSVPEPGRALLLVLGSALIFWKRRR